MTANVPYSLLHTLRACLAGTADQPAWDAAKDELDELLLAEPMSPAETTACSLCEAGHVPLTPCDGLLTDAERELLRPVPSILDASGPVSFEWHCGDLGPRPSVQQDTDAITYLAHDRRSRCRVHLLWGRSDRFPSAQLITAFPGGLVDSYREEHDARSEEAIEWFLSFGDSDRSAWTFWETIELLLVTVPPLCGACRRPLEPDYGVEECECEVPEPLVTCECNPRGGDREHTRYCPRYEVPA